MLRLSIVTACSLVTMLTFGGCAWQRTSRSSGFLPANTAIGGLRSRSEIPHKVTVWRFTGDMFGTIAANMWADGCRGRDFEVVDSQLQQGSRVTPTSSDLQRLGEEFGVDGVFVGRVLVEQKGLAYFDSHISIELIDVKTGKVVWSAEAEDPTFATTFSSIEAVRHAIRSALRLLDRDMLRMRTPSVAGGLQCGTTDTAVTSHYRYGTPIAFQPVTVLTSAGFVVGYSETRRNPLWAAYRVFASASPQTHQRPFGFRVDRRTDARVNHDAYTRSGYDRGHLAPNYAIVTRYGRSAQLETFYMSNIIPQRPKLNRQVWRRLEEKVAKRWANDFEEVWIVTGPVFDNEREALQSGVEIPDACYKIVADELNGQLRVLAFIIPQDVDSRAPLESFLVSVDAVESATGIDFFCGLDDAIENRLEASASVRLW